MAIMIILSGMLFYIFYLLSKNDEHRQTKIALIKSEFHQRMGRCGLVTKIYENSNKKFTNFFVENFSYGLNLFGGINQSGGIDKVYFRHNGGRAKTFPVIFVFDVAISSIPSENWADRTISAIEEELKLFKEGAHFFNETVLADANAGAGYDYTPSKPVLNQTYTGYPH